MVRVEVKQKKRPEDDEVLNTFAFITIDIDEWSLKRCKCEVIMFSTVVALNEEKVTEQNQIVVIH